MIEKNKEDITLDESQKTKNTIITNLIFKYKKDSEKICEIKYDKNKKELMIFYIFKFETFNFLEISDSQLRRVQSFITQIFIKAFGPCLSDFKKKKFKIKEKGIIRSYIAKEDILKKSKEKYFFWKEEIDFNYNINVSENSFSLIISEIYPQEWIKFCLENYRIEEENND